MNDYATTSSLSSYVTSSSLTTTLNDYVTSSSLTTTLNDYVTTSSLSSYVTNSALSSTLGDYLTSSSLTTTLGDYVTSSSLSTTLGDYATTSSLSSYLPKSGGTLTGNLTISNNFGHVDNSSYSFNNLQSILTIQDTDNSYYWKIASEHNGNLLFASNNMLNDSGVN